MSTTFQVHVERNDTTSPDLEAATTQGDDDGGGQGDDELDGGNMRRILLSFVPGASLSRAQLLSSLFWVSSLTMTLGVAAIFHLPAIGPVFGRYPSAYYFVLAFILTAATVELLASCWLSYSNGWHALAFAKFVLPFAYQVFLLLLSASGLGILIAKANPVR